MGSWLGLGALAVAGGIGCAPTRLALPQGYLPANSQPSDQLISQSLTPSATLAAPKLPELPSKDGKPPLFEMPSGMPGAEVPDVKLPSFERATPFADKEKAIREAYPQSDGLSAPLSGAGQSGMGLAELQQLALENSPVIKRAVAEADAAYGKVIQSGLYPNPTVGYQGDQMQPGPKPYPQNNAGQQGLFINQLIKTAGKLGLAQQVAGYDYVNALVAVQRARIDVSTAVRKNYFAALVAQRNSEVSVALAGMADEVYRLQLKQVVSGQTAGYEPLQLYAQAEQARVAVDQAEASAKAAWKQLAAALGQPNAPRVALGGRADAPAPTFDLEAIKAGMLEQHTDILTAKNSIAQAQTNCALQRKMPVPDVQFNNYHQYDTVAQNYQFGIQVGFAIPVADRNQGNIRAAQAQIASNGHQLTATENALIAQLAEAFGRYEGNVKVAARYRESILPRQTQAYRMLVRRYQAEPEKVGFNDIVVAQQNLSLSLQAYLTALTAQWQAVVDVANAAQREELFPVPAVPK